MKEPVWIPITDNDALAIGDLRSCTIEPGIEKRFLRDVSKSRQVTSNQRAFLDRLTQKYHDQLVAIRARREV